MKTTNALFILLILFFNNTARSQNATEIVRKAEQNMRGESSEGEMEMKIIRPSWERTISFKTWTRGREFSMTLVTSPAKEKGKTFLKRQNELWQYDPTIDRMIKLPPSMMSQGWMGSDFSNDDIIKESSLSEDYEHTLLESETLDGLETWKIELIPGENAAVVWGKMILWIEKENHLQLKAEYYDEDDYLIKTETASEIQEMDGRRIPTFLTIVPADEPGNKTTLKIHSIEFNKGIETSFFSQQNMKRLR
ncbi:MAG: outer membrane lipoprotein-sorting protein [Bacteroidota bacterium]